MALLNCRGAGLIWGLKWRERFRRCQIINLATSAWAAHCLHRLLKTKLRTFPLISERVTEHVRVHGRYCSAMDKPHPLLIAICSHSLCQDSQDKQQVAMFRYITQARCCAAARSCYWKWYTLQVGMIPCQITILPTQTWKQYSFIHRHFRAHALCIKDMHNLQEQVEDGSGAMPKRFLSLGVTKQISACVDRWTAE